MPVSVSGGSLDFQSTLNNDDFQAKSLQDIRLINERLKLTGDVSGINRYDEAVKSALASELRLREQLNAVIEQAKIKNLQLQELIAKPIGVAVNSEPMEALKAQLLAVNAEVLALESSFQKNIITTLEYETRIKSLAETHAILAAQIRNVRDAYLTQVDAARVANTQTATVSRSGSAAIASVGAAAGTSTNYLSAAWGWIRKIAYILPGVGVAGIIAFATEPIVKWITTLIKGNEALNQAKQDLKALNEMMAEADKAAGKQVGALKVLYDTATNVKLSMDERIKAAQQLREQDAATFANSSALAIVNGKLKKSYDDLTASIIETAKSHAALGKIEELSGKALAAQFQIDKNNNVKANQIERARAAYQLQLQNQSAESAAATAKGLSTYKAPGGTFYTPLGQLNETLRQIKEQTDIANKTPTQEISVINNTMQYMEGFVKSVSKSGEDLQKANELLGNSLENFNGLLSKVQDKKDLDNIKSALETKLASITPSDAQFKTIQDKIRQVDALEKKYSPKSTDGNADQAALRAKISLMQEVSAATAEFNQKELNSDQAAIAQVTNKFEQLKAKIAAFNADPRHANHQISTQTLVEFQTVENKAIDNQQNINENQYIQQDIEKKKKLYADYEAYRQKVGATTADKEYANLLLSGKDFETYLNNIKNSIDKTDVTAPIEARRLLTQKEIDENNEKQKQAYHDLLIQSATYEQQRQGIIAVGAQNVALLLANGQTERARQEAVNTQESLDNLAVEQVKKLDAYKDLYSNIDYLSTAAAKKEISRLYTFAAVSLATGKISIAAYNEIIKTLDAVDKRIDDKVPSALKSIGSELQNIASEVGAFDEQLGKVLQTAGKLVSAVGSIKADYKTLTSTSEDVSPYDKVTAGLGIVGTAIGIVTSIVGLFSNAKEKAEQLQYSNQLQIKQTEAINKALERQLELTKQIYGPERISGYLKQLTDVNAAIDKQSAALGGKVLLGDNKQTNDLINSFNSGTLTNPRWEKLIEQQIAAGKLLQLTGKETSDQLQNLIDNDKLDEKTAANAKSLIDLRQQVIDTQNALNEDLTGTSIDSLKSDIQSLFESSTTSAEDWANNFQNIIRKAVEQGFQKNYLEKQLQGFYDDLAKFTQQDGGILSKDSIQKLQDEYNTIIKNAQTEAEQIKQQTGIAITTPGSTNNQTEAGAIKGITSEEAGLLVGQFNGQRVATIQTRDEIIKGNAINSQLYAMAVNSFNLQVKIEANTFRTANNTEKLDSIDKTLAGMSTKMSSANNSLAANGR